MGYFKQQKRGAWGWHHTKMRDPRRVERLWLAMAVAQIWQVAVGGEAEAKEEDPKAAEQAGRGMEESCARRGQRILEIKVMQGKPSPLGRFLPQKWPTSLAAVLRSSAAWAERKRKRQRKRTEKQRKKARKRESKRAHPKNLHV
ncbi:hypothetical protein [Ktedonobacter sp. SOSP1-52]|uniref:hypothetical protein n=1 Tax=Ktedonobacter sp. SOSP1-52 TaxID=2778366 RepID=UPI0019156972|nr:hypothetical protein [Ktedonobacter sp. SOSP1-52]